VGIWRYYFLILLLVPILFSFSIPSAFAAEVIVPVGSSVPGCEDTNECWLPAEISVDVGETVVWSNDDTAAHTVTSGSAADGSDGNFDSGLFMAGTTFSWTAEAAGEYPYYCAVHPWMAGVVIVGAAAQTTEDLTASIQTGIAKVGSTLTIDVAFTHTDGSATEHVNYDILAIQGTQVVLDEKGVHDHDGQSSHTTVALPSDDVVTIDITFNGFGIDLPFTGPVGQVFTFFVFVEPETEPVPQVSVFTSRSSYNEGETIVISGQVSVVIVDAPMTIQIFNLGNLIEIVQLVVAQDGSFTHTLIAQGPQWQNEGEYVVRASYGAGSIAETTFQFFKIGAPSEISGFFEVDAGTGGTFDVGYTISGGTVKNMIVDSEIFALIVTIDSTMDGSLTLDLPRESIDAKKSNGSDDLFIIIIDGTEVIYDEAITNENTRTLTIRFEAGDSEISILGTFIVNGGQPQPPEEPEIPSLGPGEVSNPPGSSVPGCEDTNECFIPSEITINVGDTVTWFNHDTAAHTVTSGTAADGPDGIFDSSLFMAGATFSWTAQAAGEYPYHCMVHPWMAGVVIAVGEQIPEPELEPEPEPEPEIPPSVNIRTDRSTYHPGETIEVSGIVRHFDGRSVSLKIVNPFGGLVLVDQADLSSGGAFNEQYKIAGPQWTKSGSYTVTVQAGSAKAQTEFFLRIPSTVPPPSQQTTEIVVARGSSVPGCEETNECFIPFEARVNVGDTVTWFNHDTAAHTVTSGSAADGPNGIFDSSLFMAGTEFSHTFDAAGEYEYFCMVHPWMAGVVLVGEGGPVTRPPSNISISVESDKSVYDLGDLVEIDVSISGINSREQVAITVTDRSGTAVISRTLTTDSSGHAELEFRIPEDFRTGTYLVSATSSIDGKTYKARDVFKIKSQFNQIRIVSVEPTNQQGQHSDFEAGELGFVKVVLDADKDIAVLITVNLFDSELTTLGIGSLKTTLNDGRTEMILSFMIPDDAALGEAEIFASVFSDWPRNGGIPLTPEVSAEVDIR